MCRAISSKHPQVVQYLELAKNFGEHHAVLAGLAHARGARVAVLDDDGQNPPEEVVRMLRHLDEHELDVVYGRYVQRKHSWDRQLGSWFNDRLANVLLRKPKGIYLSSFKVMSAFLVREIVRYQGPYPYIDGLIFRTTQRVGQIEVAHAERLAGRSNYNLRRLVRLGLNMMLGFSILPLRLGILVGFLASMLSGIWLMVIVFEKLFIHPDVAVGLPSTLASMAFFSGTQLVVLGIVGEYVGRSYLSTSGMPQYIVRHHVIGNQSHAR